MSQLNHGYLMAPMNPINLHQIAIEAMRSRGLLPAFAPQALQQAGNARPADSQAGHGDIADLRQLTWFSIDNDDTRDLDQLSVAAILGFLLLCLSVIGWIVRTGWKCKT